MYNFFKKASLAACCMGLAVTVFAQKTPVGYVIKESGCASGGDDYYFFDNGVVQSECSLGCGSVYVQIGTWTQQGEVINVTLTQRYVGVGEGESYTAGNLDIYDSYRANNQSIAKTIEFSWTPDEGNSEGCTKIEAHNYGDDTDFRRWLRTKFVGKYPETSQRLLTAAELKKYSKAELKIMRNEIFARYGYLFQTEEMKSYFKKQGYIHNNMNDVTAFLSEIEIKNIEAIKKAESSVK